MAVFAELQIKDSDNNKRWGGTVLKTPPICTVTDMQDMLKSAGTYNYKVDGDFGRKSEKALKLFQWACKNIDAYIQAGAHQKRTLSNSIGVNGKFNKATYDELLDWKKNKKETTGDLIRISFSSFSNIEASSGFKRLRSPKVFIDEIVISKAAKKLLTELNKTAKNEKVIIKINQAFRVSGAKVTGAVVTPATKSQHLIGHAIDCNIADGNNWNTSTNFKKGTETKSAKNLIKAITNSGYRWGGNFGKKDTPHFDKQVGSATFTYDAKFFFNQRMISLGQPIPKEII